MRYKNLIMLFLIIITVFSGCSSIPTASITINDLLLQHETEHFKFYSVEQDKKCLDDLAKEIEDNYERLTTDLDITINYKPQIYIFPDRKSLHESIGSENIPSYTVGTAWGKDIKMVSPLNPGSGQSYESIKAVLLHEFVHVLQMNMNKNYDKIPVWMLEGVAMYEADQLGPAKSQLSANTPTIEALTKDFYNTQHSYQYAYSLIDFIIKEYGKDKVPMILKAPGEIEKILGTSLEEFEKQWREYIKFNYINF